MFRFQRIALPTGHIDTRQGRLGPDGIAAKIGNLIPGPGRRIPLREGIGVVPDLPVRIGFGFFHRILACGGTFESLPREDLADRSARCLHFRRRAFGPTNCKRTDHVEGLRQVQHFAQGDLVSDAGVPDALKPAQMRREHHVIAGARHGLDDGKVAMRPAFLEAQVDQRRTLRKVMVSTGNLARTLFPPRIGDDDEVPVLLVAGRRRLDTVMDDIFKNVGSDKTAIEIPAGRSFRQPVED